MLRYRINRPTYWAMCALVIALVFALSFTGHRSTGLELMVVLVVAGLDIYLGSIPGEPDANNWGEPPLSGIQFRRNWPTN